MQKYAIVVAGGSGTRMKSELPKQFIKLAEKPILMHTLEAFHFDDIQIILVLPESQIPYWKELVDEHQFKIPHNIIAGGEQRFHSVKNGLSSIKADDGLVAIHDGVRPLIKRQIISESFEQAKRTGNAIVSIQLKDSIRSITPHANQQEDRTNFRLIQTPQTFKVQLIKRAFEQEYTPSFTDDASVLEQAGHSISLIEGDYKNIKITTPEDLLVAETLLKA
ncbi:2-C-methyl-D-erythritol 4-phosphate cytidylyltransferase [uncultured Roseivirga sp.]|uniref:2-C-methyl-D-erythritol 4-phosphate cytidylyltransferase n=1 Tax=uncultured Roseivirga sp. TaxID=543088 RepID=UPI000D78CB19|nr:2-C-methyl-D-erythritol 4-phosphate cytidylyltransferase [uncultured Roseivirga sp.]PWL24774.1 MAG: 2-C-methyl-D-erythritol 4-phosphate cytidylyltransferase [Roseivirga sp. XM-24bin3]